MKLELETKDLEQIADMVAERLKEHLTFNKEPEDKIFDVEQLGEYLGVDASWIYKKVSLKEIPYFKVGKYTRFKKSAIDKWIDRSTMKAIKW